MNQPTTAEPPVRLKEYEAAEVRLNEEDARTLRHTVGTRLDISPGEQHGTWTVKATSYVGTIVTPFIQILITPKVATANLFLMLEADGQTMAVGDEIFDYDRTNDLMPAFATFFARHLERAVGRGVPREYRAEAERLPGIRGRVDLAAQQRLAGLSFPVECRYDEYSAETLLNRVLRGALWRLNRLPRVTPATRQTLLSLDRRLDEAGPIRPADLRRTVRFTRLNEHCRGAEHLARLVLDNASVIDSAGTSGAGVFLVDMNKVFERFVENRLRRHLDGRMIVNGQWPDHLDEDHRVRIRPDLVFERPQGGAVYVGDTKYKITNDGFAREADNYQLLAYCTALGLDEGILVYCQHDGKAPPREVKVRGLSTVLRTYPLGLQGSVDDVEDQLESLARTIECRSPAMSAAT